MNITSILSQPAANSFNVAYRPLQFIAFSNVAPLQGQPIYCDIYFNSKFYKTITAYTQDYSYIGNTLWLWWRFDIQDAAQEYLNVYRPALPLGAFARTDLTPPPPTSMTTCFCRFRGSSYDANGLLIPEAPVPVQGTLGVDSVAGGGFLSNTFYVLNATLQQLDNQTLSSHLQTYRFPLITAGVYPLTHIDRDSNLDIYLDEYGHFPFIIMGLPTGAVEAQCNLILYYKSNGVIINQTLITNFKLSVGTWYIPYGIMDLLSIDATIPFLGNDDFSPIQFYHLEIYDVTHSQKLLITPTYNVQRGADDKTRVWFLNYMGHYDQLSFLRSEESFKTSSSDKFTPLKMAPASSSKYFVGKGRFNIRANEELTLSGLFTESQMPWLKELLASPGGYIEWPGSQGQRPQLIPIKFIDTPVITKKQDDRFSYEVVVKYEPANDVITLRN